MSLYSMRVESVVFEEVAAREEEVRIHSKLHLHFNFLSFH
jgi:hypothetical protein